MHKKSYTPKKRCQNKKAIAQNKRRIDHTYCRSNTENIAEQNTTYSESSESIITVGGPSTVYEIESKSTYNLRHKRTEQSTITAANVEKNTTYSEPICPSVSQNAHTAFTNIEQSTSQTGPTSSHGTGGTYTDVLLTQRNTLLSRIEQNKNDDELKNELYRIDGMLMDMEKHRISNEILRLGMVEVGKHKIDKKYQRRII